MSTTYRIRDAVGEDADTIVAFTLEEAREAESIHLDVTAVRRGVRGAFAEPPLARYWVAEAPDGRVVANISAVTEWSNFHGGHYWWVQSLFVVPEHRGRGLVDLLLDRLAAEAKNAEALNLRLYAHHSNSRAHSAYERCRFTDAPYVVMVREL
jgi:GNAT superfamily N-acetyltransferase